MVVRRPNLYLLALNRNHDELVQALEGNDTASIDWQDREGNTCLHILCRQDELHAGAISNVLSKRPRLVAQPNNACWTPLHLALDQRSGMRLRGSEVNEEHSTVLSQLVRACPEALLVQRESSYSRETPFDMACKNKFIDLELFRIMLTFYPQQLTRDKHKNEVNLRKLFEAMLHGHMELILLTSLFRRVPTGEDSTYLLHAACQERVPRSYFDELLQQAYPLPIEEMLLRPDPIDGSLPLHHAVAFHKDAPGYSEYTVTRLMELQPKAADTTNHIGRYPLHRLVENPVPFMVMIPEALLVAASIRDPVSTLWPFEMAAISANRSSRHLSVLYRVLRAAPEVVSFGIPASGAAPETRLG